MNISTSFLFKRLPNQVLRKFSPIEAFVLNVISLLLSRREMEVILLTLILSLNLINHKPACIYTHNGAIHLADGLIYACEFETRTFVLSSIGGTEVEDESAALQLLIDLTIAYNCGGMLVLEFVYKQVGNQNE